MIEPIIVKVPDSKEYMINPLFFNELRIARSEYQRDLSNLDKQNDYLKACNSFFDKFQWYCSTILKSGSYDDDDKIAECIFKTDNTSILSKEYLRKSLFVAGLYIDELKRLIIHENTDRYFDTISYLEIDIELLMTRVEKFVKKSKEEIISNSWRRKIVGPEEIYRSANNFFYFEECPDVRNLNFREVKPASIFLIRQCLEIYGRNIIGYDRVFSESDGQELKKNSHIAWKFIKEECSKSDSRISLPFSADSLMKIYDWSHVYIHRTILPPTYIHFYALKFLSRLFITSTDYVLIHTGKPIKQFNVADIRITKYESLKSDFKSFVERSNRTVAVDIEWMEPRVYIMSL